MSKHISYNQSIKWVLAASIAVIAFYLVLEHKAHLIAYSSYIIFAAFVVMHLFMHGSHGGHGGGQHRHGGSGKKNNQNP